jgi:hypothetical protein
VDAGIFISHRHDDTGSLGIALRRELAEVFGDKRVFLDQHGRKPGESFDDRILSELDRAGVVLVLIGRSWLTIPDESGARRLNDPQDWVRREIAIALRKPSCKVMPVLATGVDRLDADFERALPDEIRELARKTPYPFREDWYQSDLEILAKAIHDNTPIKRRTTSVTLKWPRAKAERAIDDMLWRARGVEKAIREHPYRDGANVADASNNWHDWHRHVVYELGQMFSDDVVSRRMHHPERPHADPKLSPEKRSVELANDWADDINRLEIIRGKLDVWDS